jgi:replicative DNA helicase
MNDAAHWHEQAVIGGTMEWSLAKSEPLPNEVLTLEPEHFGDQRHGIIWMAIAELIGAGDPCDEVAVFGKLYQHGHQGYGAYLAQLGYEHALCANLSYHAEKVWELGQQRLLKSRVQDIVDRSDGSYEDVAGAVADAAQSVQRMCSPGGLAHIREPLRQAVVRMEALSKNPDAMRCCKTGLDDFDAMLALEHKALSIIAGRPSMGKTAFAGGIAREIARDVTGGVVALFSLEMAAVQIIMRLIQREARVGKDGFANPRKQPTIANAVGRLWNACLYVDDRPGLSVSQMEAELKRVAPVRLILVDYLTLIKFDSGLDRHDLRVGEAVKGLKNLAKEFNCHTIALSQLNRKVEERSDKRPTMSDLRDSGAIEEHADNIVFLYRDEYYNPQSESRGHAEAIIAKQRNGKTGTVRLAFMPDFQLFAGLSRR